MSSPTPSRLKADVDPSKTAKFLANLQRTVGRRDLDDAPVTAPVVAADNDHLAYIIAIDERRDRQFQHRVIAELFTQFVSAESR